VLAVAIANIALLALFGSGPGAIVFLAATGAFGLLWMFVMPFQLELVIDADPSRRAATLIGGAQLIGSSLGPLLASLVVDDRHVSAILWLGATCILISMAAMLAALRYRSRA
jgi:predicted MFS family arabinose efflux permease